MKSTDKASQMIIDLQDKNVKLRIGLGKLLQICKNTKMNEESESWSHFMGLAQQMMDETDPNGKWEGTRLQYWLISVSEKNIMESKKTMIKTDSIISNKLKQLDKNGGK